METPLQQQLLSQPPVLECEVCKYPQVPLVPGGMHVFPSGSSGPETASGDELTGAVNQLGGELTSWGQRTLTTPIRQLSQSSSIKSKKASIIDIVVCSLPPTRRGTALALGGN